MRSVRFLLLNTAQGLCERKRLTVRPCDQPQLKPKRQRQRNSKGDALDRDLTSKSLLPNQSCLLLRLYVTVLKSYALSFDRLSPYQNGLTLSVPERTFDEKAMDGRNGPGRRT